MASSIQAKVLELIAAQVASFVPLKEQRQTLVRVNKAFRTGVHYTDVITFEGGIFDISKAHPFALSLLERSEGDIEDGCQYKFGHTICLAQANTNDVDAPMADLGFGKCCRSVRFMFTGELVITIDLDPRTVPNLKEKREYSFWQRLKADPKKESLVFQSTMQVPENVDAGVRYRSGSFANGITFTPGTITSDGHFPVGTVKGTKCDVYVGSVYLDYEFLTEKLPFNMEYCYYEVEGKSVTDEYHAYLEKPGPEGTIQDNNFVGTTFAEQLNLLIDEKISTESEPDYHPFSNNTVHDIVHPALYAYEKDVSPMNCALEEQHDEQGNTVSADRWGRPYETSKYQWLPTYFKISADGKCKIDGYVNGLDRQSDAQLYNALEGLFERFIPRFEYVYTYANALDFYTIDDEEEQYEIYDYVVPERDAHREVLKGRDLQVIVKIVDYELQPGQEYEGVWHVEGMSHENIVATGLWVAKRDSSITGGELMFKRAPTNTDVCELVQPQWDGVAREMIEEDFTLPLGKIETIEGRAIVFPNCHIHKVKKMVNTSTTEVARRRIVVFFLIDPERRIVSTREVPDQRAVLSLEDAKARRLKLMEERKFHKQTWNLRTIGLCEH